MNRTILRVVGALSMVAAVCAGMVFSPRSASATIGLPAACSVPASSPLLSRWGDQNSYFPVTGGNAENPLLWSLTGGALPSWENEPWRVLSPLDQFSVQLPPGASATPARMCVPFVENMRMFVKNPGVAGSLLHIHLDSLGSIHPTATDYGRHHATADYWVAGGAAGWVLIGGMTIPDGRGADSTQYLTITLSTSGTRATWKVDDLLMDPWKAH